MKKESKWLWLCVFVSVATIAVTTSALATNPLDPCAAPQCAEGQVWDNDWFGCVDATNGPVEPDVPPVEGP